MARLLCFLIALSTLLVAPFVSAWERGDSLRAPSRTLHRRGGEWEVHIIQENGRRQVYRGLREPSRESRVLKLHTLGDADISTGPPRISQIEPRADRGQSVERIEGGFVAPARRRAYSYR